MPQLSDDTVKEHRDAAFRRRGRPITFRQVTEVVNRKTGQATVTNEDTPIGANAATDDDDPGALTSQVDDKTIRGSAGRYQVGDRIFRIRHSDMPETPPKTTDQIVYQGEVYRIIEHNRSTCGNVWDVICRKT